MEAQAAIMIGTAMIARHGGHCTRVPAMPQNRAPQTRDSIKEGSHHVTPATPTLRTTTFATTFAFALSVSAATIANKQRSILGGRLRCLPRGSIADLIQVCLHSFPVLSLKLLLIIAQTMIQFVSMSGRIPFHGFHNLERLCIQSGKRAKGFTTKNNLDGVIHGVRRKCLYEEILKHNIVQSRSTRGLVISVSGHHSVKLHLDILAADFGAIRNMGLGDV